MGEDTEGNSGNPCFSAAIRKIPTGIDGLDEILDGGLPAAGLTLLSGGPGSGKTVIGLQFLVQGALLGHPGIMLTFEEREDSLRRYSAAFGWDIGTLEAKGSIAIISARFNPDAIISGDFDLGSVMAILRHKARALEARRVIIDAPDVLLRLLGDRTKERGQLYKLNEWLRDDGLCAVMTVKDSIGEGSDSYREFLHYMAECVIQLDQRVMDQVTTRRMRVIKFRGSAYGRNEYPFGITREGAMVIPVTHASLGHRALGESIPSGIAGLDTITSGGYRRNSCTLITGTSGTGKTTFACSFTREATSRGERVFYLNFEESLDAMVSCMLGPGIDLRPALESGLLRFVSIMPESQGIEEHLIQAFGVISEFEPSFIVVDAISACRRMGSEQAAFDYMLRLIDHCKARGITSVLTNLTANSGEAMQITGMDLSSVIDMVVILRNIETSGSMERELLILKSRGRNHSNRVHRFGISSRGVEILGVGQESGNVC